MSKNTHKVPTPVGAKELKLDVPITGSVEVGIEWVAKALANADSDLQARFFAAFTKYIHQWPDFTPLMWEQQSDHIRNSTAEEEREEVAKLFHVFQAMMRHPII